MTRLVALLLVMAVLVLQVSTQSMTRRGTGGRVVAIQSDTECEVADIIFVLDSSGSIGEANWKLVLEFCKNMVKDLVIGAMNIQVGVVTYGNEASLQFNLNAYDNSLDMQAAISNIEWKNQNTNTSGGIRFAHREMFLEARGDRGYASNIMIVITDGASTWDNQLTIPEADAARTKGISIFAIGITDQVNEAELDGIANKPSVDFVRQVQSFDALDMIRESILAQTCLVLIQCREDNDVVFVLDSSGSVGNDNFKFMKNFVADLINSSLVVSNDVTGDRARIGLMTFSDSAKVEFQLNKYNNRLDVISAVRNIKYQSGATNTAAALQLLRDMFSAANGARADRRHIAVLFTDGGSNIFDQTITEAAISKVAGIDIIPVAVTKWVNMVELKAIATPPADKNIMKVTNFNAIDEIRAALKDHLCMSTTFCSSSPCKNGAACKELMMDYRCVCPDRWVGKNCDIACSGRADVVYVVDSSSSIGEANYYKLLDKLRLLANELNLAPALTRLGVLTFGTTSEVRVNLGTNMEKKAAVSSLIFPYSRGGTNTASALGDLEDMFDVDNGGRTDAHDVAIVFTDGASNDPAATFDAAVKAREAGVHLMVVGIKLDSVLRQKELRGIASDPDSVNVINLPNFLSLDDNTAFTQIQSTVTEAVCNIKNECSSNPCQGGAQCVDGLFKYTCLCPIDRTGPNCEREARGSGDARLDLLLAVDSSGSIRSSRFEDLKNWMKTFISFLDIRQEATRVAVVSFSNDARTEFKLNRYRLKEDILQAIDRITYSRGTTNIANALSLMRDLFQVSNGGRDDVPDVAIILTDGVATVDKERTLPEAINNRIAGIHMMVVAAESSATNLEYRGIASNPVSANIFAVERFGDLPSIVENLVASIVDSVDECAVRPCRNSGRCVSGLGTYLCICRDPNTGRNCETSCTRQLDVVFALDASGSTEEMFYQTQLVVKEIVLGLNFEAGRTRVGILTYSDEPHIEFRLNTYTSRLEVETAVAYLRTVGRTATADALRTARRDMFTSAAGDRSAVDNILIVLTDGFSNVRQTDTVTEAQALKNDNVRVMVVAMGTSVNRQEVEAIATRPSGNNAFYVRSELDVSLASSALVGRLCQ